MVKIAYVDFSIAFISNVNGGRKEKTRKGCINMIQMTTQSIALTLSEISNPSAFCCLGSKAALDHIC